MFFLQTSILFSPFQFSLSFLSFVLVNNYMHTQCPILDRQPVNVSLVVTDYFVSKRYPSLTSRQHEPNLNAESAERDFFGGTEILETCLMGNGPCTPLSGNFTFHLSQPMRVLKPTLSFSLNFKFRSCTCFSNAL